MSECSLGNMFVWTSAIDRLVWRERWNCVICKSKNPSDYQEMIVFGRLSLTKGISLS